MADARALPTALGERVRRYRLMRGLTQRVCAELAGMSASMLCRIETGERSLERRAHIEALAGVLEVSPAELLGQPYQLPGRSAARAQASVEHIREALMGTELGEVGNLEPFRPLPELERMVTQSRVHLFRLGDVAAATAGQAEALVELHAHAAAGADAERVESLRLLALACGTAATTCKWLGYPELGWIAAIRAREAAAQAEDPALAAYAEYEVSYMTHPYGLALINARRAIDRAVGQVGGDPTAQQMLGMLHLSAALSAAVVGHGDDVRAHLVEVDDIAGRTGDQAGFEMYFGPTNAAIWKMAIAVEQQDGGRAREIARALPVSAIPGKCRQATYYQDLGRALAQDGRPREAVHALMSAERLNAVEIRNNSMAHQVVLDLLPQVNRATGSVELRALAHRMGIIT